jgi:two-component system, OmpR family, sensor histidine kinase CiaH
MTTMSIFQTRRLALITIVYWILLSYVIAALVWWFIALNQQNEKMTELLLNELVQTDPAYTKKASSITDAYQRKHAQYFGEGITFFALIVLGAVFVYRATRRQLRLSRQQQNFMMTVTHELKTPIAIARLNLETLQRRQLPEEQQHKLIANTLHEADRLNALISNILMASQLDAGGYTSSKTNIDFSDLVERTVIDFGQRFTERRFETDVQDGIYVYGEELLLQMLLNNLVENAVKYSPKNALVSVSLARHQKQMVLAVHDEGCGIEEDEHEKIFEKFYRIGNESTRTTKGTGLGLYLCKMIAANHNATISVQSTPGKGSTFTVTFKP